MSIVIRQSVEAPNHSVFKINSTHCPMAQSVPVSIQEKLPFTKSTSWLKCKQFRSQLVYFRFWRLNKHRDGYRLVDNRCGHIAREKHKLTPGKINWNSEMSTGSVQLFGIICEFDYQHRTKLGPHQQRWHFKLHRGDHKNVWCKQNRATIKRSKRMFILSTGNKRERDAANGNRFGSEPVSQCEPNENGLTERQCLQFPIVGVLRCRSLSTTSKRQDNWTFSRAVDLN